MSDPKKCAHPACSCPPEEGSHYCSQICKDSKGVASIKCDCKHPGCSGETY